MEISQYDPATSFNDEDVTVIVQEGVTKKGPLG
jgi:hypothetical protein